MIAVELGELLMKADFLNNRKFFPLLYDLYDYLGLAHRGELMAILVILLPRKLTVGLTQRLLV